MKSLRFLDRRVGFSLAAVGLLLGMVAPAVVPTLASAAVLTSRSVEMSSAVVGATNVNYQVAFTPQTTGATDMIIYFCDNTPISGTACTTPTGLSTAGATVTAGTGTTGAALDSTTNDTANPGGVGHTGQIAITGMTLGTSAVTLTIGGVTNPSTAETFYARIQTYNSEPAQSSAWAAGPTDTTYKDNGSVALSTSNSIGVQAAVLESLTFCVFGDPGNVNSTTSNEASDDSGYLSGTGTNVGTINSNNIDDLGALTSTSTVPVTDQGPGSSCSDSAAGTYAGGTYASSGFIPASVTLGQYVANGIYALNSSNVSYAADWTQLSTNAASGATVYLKSSNSCSGGGLSTGSGSSCGIPASSGTLTAGTPGFGLAVGTPVNLDGQTGTGTDGAIAPNSNYSAKYDLGSATNGAYGDPIYDTGATPGPETNWDVPLGIGAAISNNTAAGNYHDSLNLVAVGTF